MIEINETQHAVLVDWPKALEVKKLRAAFGAPAWVVNEAQLAYNVGIFEKFTGARGRIFYPVKTNPALTVLQLLAKLGVGADCASNSEVELALFAGIKIENVSYNSPVQDVALCKALLLAGGKVVMDDIDAILALQNELKGVSFEGRISLRINLPEFVSYAQANDNQELMAHGHKSSKFGIPAEDLAALLPSISLPISGLHVHVGTQMDNMASFEFAISQLNSLADELNRHGHPITDINIGGGLGIPFSHNDRFPALEFWADTLLATQRNNYQYSVEPGHALVGNTVALTNRSIDGKEFKR
jgi:diaminopimelate decarboxylase